MRKRHSGKYLARIWTILFIALLIGGELWLLTSVPLEGINKQEHNASAQSHDKEKPCEHIQPWASYSGAFQQDLCAVATKNLIFIDAYHDTINAISTLLVAIFTFTLWQSSEKMWRASLSQSADMKATIQAAERSADATHIIAASDRAWMIHDGLTVADISDSTINNVFYKKSLGFIVQWKNKGRSPAIHVRNYTDYKIVGVTDRDVPRFESNSDLAAMGAPVGPDSQVESNLIVINEAEAARLLEKDKVAVIIYSRIRYHDIFNPIKPRESEICLRIAFTGYHRTAGGQPEKNWQTTPIGLQNSAT